VGRVGALAIALGVGAAVAAPALAFADTDGSGGSTGSSEAGGALTRSSATTGDSRAASRGAFWDGDANSSDGDESSRRPAGRGSGSAAESSDPVEVTGEAAEPESSDPIEEVIDAVGEDAAGGSAPPSGDPQQAESTPAQVPSQASGADARPGDAGRRVAPATEVGASPAAGDVAGQDVAVGAPVPADAAVSGPPVETEVSAIVSDVVPPVGEVGSDSVGVVADSVPVMAPAPAAVSDGLGSGLLGWLGAGGGGSLPLAGPLMLGLAGVARRDFDRPSAAVLPAAAVSSGEPLGASAAAVGNPITDLIRVFFGNGSADNPNAGILFGNGYSWTAETCPT